MALPPPPPLPPPLVPVLPLVPAPLLVLVPVPVPPPVLVLVAWEVCWVVLVLVHSWVVAVVVSALVPSWPSTPSSPLPFSTRLPSLAPFLSWPLAAGAPDCLISIKLPVVLMSIRDGHEGKGEADMPSMIWTQRSGKLCTAGFRTDPPWCRLRP